MAVIVAIHPLAATEFLLFTRASLPHALVVGLDAVPDSLGVFSHWPTGPYLPYYQSIVFQRMPTAGLVLDQQQRILALNPVAEQLFQVRSDQVEEQLLSQISFPFY